MSRGREVKEFRRGKGEDVRLEALAKICIRFSWFVNNVLELRSENVDKAILLSPTGEYGIIMTG